MCPLSFSSIIQLAQRKMGQLIDSQLTRMVKTKNQKLRIKYRVDPVESVNSVLYSNNGSKQRSRSRPYNSDLGKKNKPFMILQDLLCFYQSSTNTYKAASPSLLMSENQIQISCILQCLQRNAFVACKYLAHRTEIET